MHSNFISIALLGLTVTFGASPSRADQPVAAHAGTLLPTGQWITPTAAAGAAYQPLNPNLKDMPKLPAGYADSEALSPNGKTLLVLTTGYNYVVDAAGKELPKDSTQFVFVFDVSSGRAVQRQVLQVSNSYVGIAFAPDGKSFYVPGAGEDNLHVFTLQGANWVESGTPIALGHKTANGISQQPTATGVAVTGDGKRALVANRYNDSVSVIDLTLRSVIGERDLRPGKNGGVPGTPGGEYPNSIAIVGSTRAYVSSERDRELVVLDISLQVPVILGRIPLQGNPNKMVVSRDGRMLFVASDNADVVSVIDTARNVVTGTVSTIAPNGVLDPNRAKYKGASPNGLTLSPDGNTLYVTDRGTNAVAVVSVAGGIPRLVGLIPTGWSPSDIRVAADGGTLYISNAKSDPGPNPGNCLGYETVPCPVPNSPVTFAPNQYILNLTGSALLSVPTPGADELARLTRQVADNNGFDQERDDDRTIAALRKTIKHVIYIIKENRTYDQILGDLGKGNSDSHLAEFPRTTTPSQHALANNFVALDNFYDTGDVSGNGWPWSTAARESDAGAKMLPPNYAGNGGGGSYDWEGTNRNVNVALTGAARVAADPLAATLDPDTLPGQGNVAAPDGPKGEYQQGYIWNAAQRAGLTVRNYGYFIDLTRYNVAGTPAAALQIPRDRSPYPNSVQSTSANPQLGPVTDVFYRGFDDAYPDFYREREWEREFAGYAANGNLPSLSLVRLMNDHTGNYAAAIDGVNRPDIQVADNDYAVGRLVEAVAKSPFARDTLIFILEDDAQDGPDHVDAHRSTAYVVGPYVKHNTVISTHYTTVNVLRTISDVLGIDHLGIYDANQRPMSDVFDTSNPNWTFTGTASPLLKSTSLPLPKNIQFAAKAKSPRSLAYWVDKTQGMNFAEEDKVDAVLYNKILWAGLMKTDYPTNGGRSLASQVPPMARHKDDDGDDD
ncbi:bifunctional YncE family protein/alkaline phosphatase family protein [Lichenifustis flavocetrariae]|uniref:Bifunctional YncE family protein/alkaline phosphatase family protein n=1 Tax=Lichenifustis flavocetrariae TaxID=2949735 RepID=A0AA42CQC1_9HYPH|nr:bifunctional YncE family protein/alkaline phosphatase family protein [Lichenifustis flavocetrariae]MCW6511300.1 bifunctional YncE family protein/alkaline phosphatase family protein [Lichenifustis flavocetrariae]